MVRLVRSFFDRLRGAWFGFSQGHDRLTTCQLTDVLNRDAIFAAGERELKRAKRHGRWLGVVLLDLNDFKPINDQLGHDIGDEVLGEVGRVLRRCVRAEDHVGRKEGDEFLLIFPETDSQGLRSAMRRALYLVECELEVVGFSYGAHSQRFGKSSLETLAQLIHLADEKMYKDKRVKRMGL